MPLLYHAYVYLEFLILACTIYILAPSGALSDSSKVEYDDDTSVYIMIRGSKGHFNINCVNCFKIAQWNSSDSIGIYHLIVYNSKTIKTIICAYTFWPSYHIIPAEGYTTSSLKIDGVSVSPVTKYNFLNMEADHKVEATFTISQDRKMELMQKGYSWINLKL